MDYEIYWVNSKLKGFNEMANFINQRSTKEVGPFVFLS